MRFNLLSQRGFTLVEVLTVMLVLVAIASITVESTKDFVFQGRYDVTKDRYEKIKKAIIGDPNQVINGQPNIEGFVKDMGRLPRNLHELLVQNYCDNDYRISDNTPDSVIVAVGCPTGTTPSQCCTTKTPAGNWQPQTGWKGAYIETTEPDYKPNALPDGWGNTASTTDFTDQNYGWIVALKKSDGAIATNIADAVSMNIQSKGKNSCKEGTTGCSYIDIYDADYPDITSRSSIEQNDWMINLEKIQANIMASSINGSCAIATQPTDPATCQLAGRIWNYAGTPPACTGTAVPASKLGCESVNGDWSYGTLSNICMKINNSINTNAVQIEENGYANSKQFDFNVSIKPGNSLVGIYNGSNCSVGNLTTYPLNKGTICKNTNDHANFTQANCTGAWKDDGTEQYCYGITANACTTTLNGTMNKEEIKLTLYPNTTLPTINW